MGGSEIAHVTAESRSAQGPGRGERGYVELRLPETVGEFRRFWRDITRTHAEDPGSVRIRVWLQVEVVRGVALLQPHR